MADKSKREGESTMWQLNVKGNTEHRRILSEAAKRAGFVKGSGEPDLTAFVLYLIGSLEKKSSKDIKEFLLSESDSPAIA